MSASPTPCPSGSPGGSADPAVAAAVVPPAATFANGPTASFPLGDLATNPVDGTGAAISLNQSAAEAATSMNCTLTVPDNPLSARGLATPYQLGDGCTMADAVDEGAFVEATILAPNGSVQIYDPLVITAGTTPAAAPVAPNIPRGSAVIIDVGSNGTNLVLEGRGARQGNCVDALGQSVIGQVSACNAVSFYRVADAEIAAGTLKVPPIGTSTDGQPCQTVRDFALVDQDQSDNVISTYLINANGQTAQDTKANVNAVTGATPIGNGSDDRLLSDFVDPANGCTAFSATNPTDAAGASGSQALNELSARVNQTGTIAVVPPNDEMTLVNGAYSIAKTNVYRSLVDQPMLVGRVDADHGGRGLLPEPGQHRAGAQPAGHDQRPRLCLPGPVDGRQPGDLPGGQAGCLVRGPGLYQVRSDQPGQRHHGRQWRGHLGDLQPDPADGDRPSRGHRHADGHADGLAVSHADGLAVSHADGLAVRCAAEP